MVQGLTDQFTGETPDNRNFAAGVYGATGLQGEGWFNRETLGLYNLNHSPVQSIFAVGIYGGKTKSIWSATEGKRFVGGPAIGHGRKIRTQRTNRLSEMPGFNFVAGFTNYHAITQPVYHPVAATMPANMSGFTGGWGDKKLAPSTVYGVVGLGQYENSLKVNEIIEGVFDMSQEANYQPLGYWQTNSQMFSHGSTGDGLSKEEIRDHVSINWMGLYGQSGSAFNNWLGSSYSPFDRASVSFEATPPTDVMGTTGLSPRPGVYSKLPSGRAASQGNARDEYDTARFPGAHKYAEKVDSRARNKIDFSEPYRVSFWNRHKLLGKSSIQSLLMPILKSTRIGAGANKGRTSNYDLLTGYPGFEIKSVSRSGLWFENIKWEGIADDINIYAPDVIASYLGKDVEPFTAQANFNYAMLEQGRRTPQFIAKKLFEHWKMYPDSHNNLAIMLDKAMKGESVNKIIGGMSYIGSFSQRHGIGTRPYVLNPIPDKIANETKQSWSELDIKDALNTRVFNNDSRQLWQTMMLAEPDNNPIGVWFDTQDPSHEFFGITDLNKLRESGDLNYTTSEGQSKRISIIKDKDLWDMHRALAAKDTNQLSESTIDWFGSKVTKYGWCHIMQGTTPVRLDKMKAPVALPRFWAPLFVPFRSINDFAPRLYFGVDETTRRVGQAVGHAVNNHASYWLDANVNEVLPDGWKGPYTASELADYERQFGALQATPSTPYQKIWVKQGETSISPDFYLKEISANEYKVGILRNNQDTDKTSDYWTGIRNDRYLDRPDAPSPGAGPANTFAPTSWMEGISAALRLENDSTSVGGRNAVVGYSRETLTGFNPHYDDFDDNRLFGGVTLKPGGKTYQDQTRI